MTQREVSKREWTAIGRIEEINSGSLQRIADATEKMAASYDNLRCECDQYKTWYKDERQKRQHADRQIIALRGVITKLKKAKAVTA